MMYINKEDRNDDISPRTHISINNSVNEYNNKINTFKNNYNDSIENKLRRLIHLSMIGAKQKNHKKNQSISEKKNNSEDKNEKLHFNFKIHKKLTPFQVYEKSKTLISSLIKQNINKTLSSNHIRQFPIKNLKTMNKELIIKNEIEKLTFNNNIKIPPVKTRFHTISTFSKSEKNFDQINSNKNLILKQNSKEKKPFKKSYSTNYRFLSNKNRALSNKNFFSTQRKFGFNKYFSKKNYDKKNKLPMVLNSLQIHSNIPLFLLDTICLDGKKKKSYYFKRPHKK